MVEKPKLYTRCLRCNRKLKTPKAQALGYGSCCLKEVQNEYKKTQKTIIQILSKYTKV